ILTVIVLSCAALAQTPANGPRASAADEKAQSVRITRQPVVELADQQSAVIAWSSDQVSGTQVKYGTAPDALNQHAEMPWGSLTHRVELKNLQPGTTYYFVAIAGDARGNG